LEQVNIKKRLNESKKKSEIDYLKLQERGKEVSMGLLKSMKPMVVESLKVDKSAT